MNKHDQHELQIVKTLVKAAPSRLAIRQLNNIIGVSNAGNRISSARAKGAPILGHWVKEGGTKFKRYTVALRDARKWLKDRAA